jgi:SAM-dependent methyltransferase
MSGVLPRRIERLWFRLTLAAATLGRTAPLVPVSRSFGFDRGQPIDRHYIEDFLRRHGSWPGYAAGDIQGEVMEVGDDVYTRRFGGDDVTRVEVLHVSADNPAATLVGDLVSGKGVPQEAFDCVICTQTLNMVYDVRAAVRTLARALKPEGVLLLTVAGVCPAARPDRDLWGDYWRFTSLATRRVLEEEFPPSGVHVEAYGNLASAIGFMRGLAAGDLRTDELAPADPDYEILIAARAQRST